MLQTHVALEDKTHPDLIAAQNLVYKPFAFEYTQAVNEAESQEYAASRFKINNLRVRFCVGKITPKKIGQFVTLWKRKDCGPIMPFEDTDPIDLFIVSVRQGEYAGQFVFPKALLCKKNIVSKNGKGGKRGIRIYAPWDTPQSPQAIKTKAWQQEYFFSIFPKMSKSIEIQRLFFVIRDEAN